MKALIEGFVIMNDFDNVGRENYSSALIEFNALLCLINNACDKQMLRTLLENTTFNYFKHGFGGNHFWVHQINDNGIVNKNRLIIVEF